MPGRLPGAGGGGPARGVRPPTARSARSARARAWGARARSERRERGDRWGAAAGRSDGVRGRDPGAGVAVASLRRASPDLGTPVRRRRRLTRHFRGGGCSAASAAPRTGGRRCTGASAAPAFGGWIGGRETREPKFRGDGLHRCSGDARDPGGALAPVQPSRRGTHAGGSRSREA